MKHNTIRFVGILLLIMGLVACGNSEDETNTAESTVDIDALAANSTSTLVKAEGEVVPLHSLNASFQTGGTVTEILVKEGDSVNVGDALIQLDSATLESFFQQAEAGVTVAEAQIGAAQAQLTLAQSGVQRAEVGVITAEAQLALVKSGPTPEELAAAQNQVAAAEGGITQAVGNRDAIVQVRGASVSAAEAQLLSANISLQNLEEAYQNIIDACFEAPDGSEVCPLYGPVEENARAQLVVVRANAQSAQAALDEARAGATPAQQSAANAGIGLAVSQRNQVQAQLDLLQSGAKDEQVQQAEVGVESAQLGVEQAQVRVVQAEAALVQAEAGLTNAQASLAAAQNALDRMTLRAPIAGTVSDVTVEVGELVGPGLPVVRLADSSEWLVETTDLTELDVVALEIGQPVSVQIDALPGEELAGIVTKVAAVAELTRGDVTYDVTIALEDYAALPLRWGMTASVDIDLE